MKRTIKRKMSNRITTSLIRAALFAGLFISTFQAGAAEHRSPLPLDNQEFTDEDFEKFFGLLEDGKITQEKNEQRCAKEEVGFTFTGANLEQPAEPTRIEYNVTKLDMSVDGRPFRSKYRNATFGEWTSQVFKPLCGGLYTFTVEYAVSLPKRTDPRDISVQIYLRRADDTRPGYMVMESHPDGGKGYATGQATVVLPLATGDEVSTWSVAANSKPVMIESIAISGYKVAHLPEMIGAFDQTEWAADMTALGSRLGAQMP
jgi:hypothetical protein